VRLSKYPSRGPLRVISDVGAALISLAHDFAAQKCIVLTVDVAYWHF